MLPLRSTFSHRSFTMCPFTALTKKNYGIFLIQISILKAENNMAACQNNAVLRFVKLTERAVTPTRSSPRAAGLDLHSAYDTKVPARGKVLVQTDLQIQLAEGFYGRVAPRSGLALKHHIDIGGGIVDEDYRGNLGVILYNHSDVPFTVSRGDRIAHLICQQICYPKLEEMKVLSITERGNRGFGSSGINQ